MTTLTEVSASCLTVSLSAQSVDPFRNSKEITERWVSHQLRPYGIRPVTLRIGETLAKGYRQEDFMETFRRYIPQSELDALKADSQPQEPPTSDNGAAEGP